MVKTNKIINKIMLPGILVSGVLATLAIGTGTYIATKTSKENSPLINRLDKGLLALSAIVVICFCLVSYNNYKQGEKFSMVVIRKYLRQAMLTNPELRDFSDVLNNPKALNSIAPLVFNSLRPSEQDRIVRIITDMHKDLQDYKKFKLEASEMDRILRTALCCTRRQILQILQEHAALHPEFINDIYAAVANADMIYLMPTRIQQHTK